MKTSAPVWVTVFAGAVLLAVVVVLFLRVQSAPGTNATYRRRHLQNQRGCEACVDAFLGTHCTGDECTDAFSSQACNYCSTYGGYDDCESSGVCPSGGISIIDIIDGNAFSGKVAQYCSYNYTNEQIRSLIGRNLTGFFGLCTNENPKQCNMSESRFADLVAKYPQDLSKSFFAVDPAVPIPSCDASSNYVLTSGPAAAFRGHGQPGLDADNIVIPYAGLNPKARNQYYMDIDTGKLYAFQSLIEFTGLPQLGNSYIYFNPNFVPACVDLGDTPNVTGVTTILDAIAAASVMYPDNFAVSVANGDINPWNVSMGTGWCKTAGECGYPSGTAVLSYNQHINTYFTLNQLLPTLFENVVKGRWVPVDWHS